MFNKKLKQELMQADKKNWELSDRISQLMEEKADPRKVIEQIMRKKLEFADVSKLPLEEQVRYHLEAQSLVKSDVLNNEINCLMDAWTKWALINAEDFAGVRDMRMSLNGMKLLLERLASIPNPREQHTEEDIFDGV